MRRKERILTKKCKMVDRVVTFNKNGYDPFLDFIKAYAILCVLLGHTFPYLHETGYSLWYGMQVPLFILIQSFHVMKKEKVQFNLRKCIERVILPFLLVQIPVYLIYLFFSSSSVIDLTINAIAGGGFGPGSYYPWIFLQMAIFLPFVRPMFNKGSKIQKAVIIIVICEACEITLSLINLPELIYRILAIRYFFLIYLAWLWVEEGIVVNKKTLTLSVLSMFSIVYFEYFYVSTEPWFFDTAWKTHRWPCYFYVSTLLCYFIYLIYQKIIYKVEKYIKILARCSYEIFLVQMAVVPLFPQLNFIPDDFARFGIRMILVIAISIIGGYHFNIIYNNILKKFKLS